MNQADRVPTKSSNAGAEQNSQRKFPHDQEADIMFASHNISARSAFIVAVLILVSPNLHAFEPDPRAPGI
jgi:hypothetical protein